MIRHVSFDFDGVLADSNQTNLNYIHRALKHVGVHLDPTLEYNRILECWGKSADALMNNLLQEHPERINDALTYFNASRSSPTYHNDILLYPGATETILNLKEKYTLSIISGSNRHIIESMLGPDLAQLFSSIHSAADYAPEFGKPSPFMLQQAMLKAGSSPQETVYIGDAPNDLRMATAAGATPIAILTGPLTRLLATELGARRIIEDIGDFPEVLLDL